MRRFAQFFTLFMVAVLSANAVPAVLNYAGQVAVNGQPFDGQGLFKFALVNADGNATYWSNDGTSANGSEPAVHVGISVNGGLYSLLLGNTGMAGMAAIDPQVFAQHGDAKLRVWFSDGVNGFQQLSPDRPFASVPYAFSAGTAQSATIAEGSINKSMLGSDVIADLNATIGMNRLSAEVTEKLDRNNTTTNYNSPSVGSLLTVPYGQTAPAGYSLYQRGTPKALVWEEKAPVSVARWGGDGVESFNGKLYFAGGINSSAQSRTFEYYRESTNEWFALSELSEDRDGASSVILDNKLYLIGGRSETSAKQYNLHTDTWSTVASIPEGIRHADAVELNNRIFLIGGKNDSDQRLNKVFEFLPNSNQWLEKENMPSARLGLKLVVLDGMIWAIGGNDGSHTRKVEIYNPIQNSWTSGPSLLNQRHAPVTWVQNGRIYVGGGLSSNFGFQDSIEVYDPAIRKWVHFGSFPEPKYYADAVILNDKVYVIGGSTAANVFSNKVYAADLNASVAGVYDLYRKDGNASAGTPIVQAEVADGSVTTAKLDATILKYLKPEITSQPQAQTVYADSNVSYSVIAEGKYLTYQWKKDGSNLTGENNSTMTITDANATLDDGNYSVVVSNDFGSVESAEILVDVNTTWATDGLVGWWKFDEGSGMVANDSSGNGNDGNLMNGPTWSIGKIGGALSFDGVDDFVFLGNPPEIGLSGNQSFSMWLKPFSFDARRNPYSKAYGGTGSFTLEPNKVMSYFYGISGSDSEPHGTYRTTSLVSLNEWNNLVLTRNLVTLTVRFFLNGLLDVSLNAEHATASIDSLNAKIGDGYTSPFHGLIDDFRIYNRALSAEEAQALYNMGQ